MHISAIMRTFRKYGRPIIHLDTSAIDCHCCCVGWQSSDRLRNEYGGPVVVSWTVRVILASCRVVSGVMYMTRCLHISTYLCCLTILVWAT